MNAIVLSPNPQYRRLQCPAGSKMLVAYAFTLLNPTTGNPASFLRVSDPDIGVPTVAQASQSGQIFKPASGSGFAHVEEWSNAAGYWYLTTDPATATVYAYAQGWTDPRGENE